MSAAYFVSAYGLHNKLAQHSLLYVFVAFLGTGNLTMKLLERAKKVIAIELDPRMVSSRLLFDIAPATAVIPAATG